ncbi:apolipoprotein N-acyltransferase [Thermosipho ferrireducens]|uniref:Apolipoprotein N-acyltransferase n=1 Tax=Thermosipho ferrireducens TaxID=2571116 RepID=A0ABX7SAJ3_9BACT|nr:apolipoprotein N-acyltransferase [Thermosipho ferrireducens]QTA38777.1 apolipoprotein N-acyltransferase [Thermosipho ferrireducens]
MLLVILSSLLTSLSMPGFLWGGIIWFSLIPLFKAMENKKVWVTTLYAFLYFFVQTFITLYWVIPVLTKNLPEFFGRFSSQTGFFIFLLLCILEASPFLFFGFMYGFFYKRFRKGTLSALFTASIYVISEYIRSLGDIGFTGGRLSDALFKDIGLLQLLPFFGTLGLTFVIVLVNYFLYSSLKSGKKFVVSFFITIGAIYMINNVISNLLPTEMGNIPIVVVQTNVDQNVKYNISSEETLKDIQTLISTTPEYLHIFPEAVFPQEDIRHSKIGLAIEKLSLNKPLILGFPSFNGASYNSAYLFEKGKIKNRYDKIKLFPFVETLPYPKIFKKFKFLKGVSYFSPGKSFKPFAPDGYPEIGVQICFESYFSEISRKLVKNGAKAIVTITNDGWYDFNTALWQHFAKSVFRAVETRRYVVQVSNKGISGVIDKYGRITSILPIREEKWKILYISSSKNETIYTKFGDWFILVAGFFALVIPVSFRKRKPTFK